MLSFCFYPILVGFLLLLIQLTSPFYSVHFLWDTGATTKKKNITSLEYPIWDFLSSNIFFCFVFRWIQVQMSDAIMWESISNVIQSEDTHSRAHEGETFRLHHRFLQKSLQHIIQVCFWKNVWNVIFIPRLLYFFLYEWVVAYSNTPGIGVKIRQ